MVRIVVADDHEVVRKGLIAIIAGHPGLEVCGVAENGQEAVERVRELNPDLILLDLSMPVMNGFQAALKIRQLAPATKILVVSTHDATTVREVASLMGADGYVSKTAASDEVLSAILLLLNGSVSPKELAGVSTPSHAAADE